MFTPGFAGTSVQGFRDWSAPLYQSIRDNVVALRQFVIANCPAIVATGDMRTTAASATRRRRSNDPLQYHASEQTVAGYIQTNYTIGDVVDGEIGVRIVNTREKLTSPVTLSNFTGVTNDFTNYLPNVSAADQVRTPVPGPAIVHADADAAELFRSQSRLHARPARRPAGSATGTFGDPQFGNNGNPNLKPYRSDNFDASLEYYASPTRVRLAGVFPPRPQRLLPIPDGR